MANRMSKIILSLLYILTFLSLVLEAAKTVTLDLIDESDKIPEHRLRKRQGGDGWRATDLIYNSTDYAFYVDIAVGDNNKNLKLAVIQNPYTWVATEWNSTDDCSPLMTDKACGIGQYSGLFSIYPPDSDSYTNLTEEFDITYSDDRFAIGVWGQDRFRLGQLSIENVNFGVARYYNATPALGLQRKSLSTPYDTFLEVMQADDVINTPSYGIYVGDIRGRQDSGKSITFGGIDEAKFDKPLRTFDTVSRDAIDLFKINLLSQGNVVARPLNQPATRPVVANLNFGTASIHVPTDIYDTIMNDIGADRSNDDYLKSYPTEGSGVEFIFEGNLTIFVPYNQMITPSIAYPGWYIVLLVPNDVNTIMGTPFFRSAYVFYDIENQEISIAPAKYNLTASNVTEVGVNNASVRALDWLYIDPSAIVEPPPEPSPTDPPKDSPTPTPTSEPSSGPPVAAIAGGTVGGVVGLAAIAALVYIFGYRPRHRNDDMPPLPIEDTGMGGAGGIVGAAGGNGYANEQFSPTKPTYTSPISSPVTSPVSELGGGASFNKGGNRYENMAAGAQRNPNVHELA